MIILSRLLLYLSVRNKIEVRTVYTKFSFRFTVPLKLYAKGKKECWMKKKYRLLKISDRKGRFISSLFMVYFSVVSKWFDSIFTIFRAINCPKLSPIFLSSRFIKFYWIQNWPKYSENISNWLSGLEIAVYLNILLISFLKKSRSRVSLLFWKQ